MKKIFLLSIFIVTLLSARNDVPSCYHALHMQNPHSTIIKELFIMVDQTTVLDQNMMIYIYKNMMHFIQNGYAITIASFSSNASGKYTDVVYEGALETLLEKSAKHDIPKKILRKYETCMHAQYTFAKKRATQALVRTLKGANKKLPHSDIIKSLDDIALHTIKVSKAQEKILLLVSDMIEHSSITSFYTAGHLKPIDTSKEIKNVKNSGHMSDFSGAKVYVIGAGMAEKSSYRDAKSLGRLTAFWKTYFSQTNAKLQAIGTPMLLEDIE